MDLTGMGSLFDFAKTVVDKVWPPEADPQKKLEAQIKIQEALQARENAVIEAQRAIIVAEMSQGDTWTKRARPAVVYVGLCFIFLVHVFLPIVSWFSQNTMPPLSLPEEFWWAWGSVVSIWSVGRTSEKLGYKSKIVDIIAGVKS